MSKLSSNVLFRWLRPDPRPADKLLKGPWSSQPPDTLGIDFFLGEASLSGKGNGAKLLNDFVELDEELGLFIKELKRVSNKANSTDACTSRG